MTELHDHGRFGIDGRNRTGRAIETCPHGRATLVAGFQVAKGGLFLGAALGSTEAGLVQAITLAADLEQVPMMHESIEERGNGGGVAEVFGPVFERSI